MRLIPALLLLVALLFGVAIPGFAQAERKRLILKDGSYQVVLKYEVVGDRVRYTSAERNGQVEEIPYALVDWPATDKWNRDHAPGANPAAAPDDNAAQNTAAEIDKEEQAERAAEKNRMPVVAPGLRLPDESGIFALDTWQGIPELVHLEQSNGNVNRDTGHTILRAAIAPLGGAKELIQLDGPESKIQLHVNQPVLYVSLDHGDAETAGPDGALTVNTGGASSVKDDKKAVSHSSPDSRYAIVRVETRRTLRTIGAMRVSMLGKVTQSEDIVPTKAEILPGGYWMKLTPKYPLDFGEYALMEILSPGEVNLDVWDFGVDPRKPENRHALTPIEDGN
ncbi:hypothetical protein [Paracidobacterium acidisoli]|uniref:hypothetical protein n=1 Tax=Paracidobacterium acidisoli TaxID=2303751 RepID=UPI0011C0CDD7|nr:hypothetical protein [Paracidobacterium acidisoli]MBT9331129.1 hypothetical protein [Paracidobacterium acidisoli]